MGPGERSPSLKETFVGSVVLLLLVGIAAGVFFKQFHYDRSIYAVADAAEEPAADRRGEEIASAFDAVEPAIARPYTPAERFGAETLYNKINGKAPQYTDAGFEALTCQRFTPAEAPGWFEVYLYRMNDHRAAYSVFSTQRRSGGETLEFTPFAYRSGGAVFFARGRHYVEIVPSESSEAVAEAVRRFAAALAASLEAGPGIDELELFPSEGLLADSVALLARNVFGIAELRDVFSARYDVNGQTVTAFLARRADAAAAAEDARAFHAFFIANGAEPVETDLAIASLRAATIFDTYEMVFTAGPFVAGVHECPDRPTAEQIIGRLHATLSAEAE